MLNLTTTIQITSDSSSNSLPGTITPVERSVASVTLSMLMQSGYFQNIFDAMSNI